MYPIYISLGAINFVLYYFLMIILKNKSICRSIIIYNTTIISISLSFALIRKKFALYIIILK